jgi:thiol-disulfide isomerase/thioredoxin
MTRPKLAIAVAVAVMVVLAVVAISIGKITAPREQKTADALSAIAPKSSPPKSGDLNAEAAQATKPDVTPGVIYTASFNDVDGKSQSLGQWQKKLLVINFWATWCAPCKEEMPIFAKLQQRLGSNGVQFIGIAADSRLNVVNFSQKTPVGYPLYPSESGAIDFSKRLGNRLGLLPHTVVVAPGGEVVYAKLGQIVEGDFATILLQHLPKQH